MGAIVGAISGSQGDTSTQTNNVTLGNASALDQQGTAIQGAQLGALQGMVGAGPGQQDVSNAFGANQDYAAMLKQFMGNGGLPNQQQTNSAMASAQQMFAPQQAALNQSMTQAGYQNQQQAALMGRSANDPTLTNQMNTSFMNAEQGLQSQQTQYGSQLARAMPQQQVAYGQAYTGVMNGLASQAMSNRQALFGLGNQLQTQDQNFLLGAADRSQTVHSGGGLAGTLNGAMAGNSADISNASQIMGSVGKMMAM